MDDYDCLDTQYLGGYDLDGSTQKSEMHCASKCCQHPDCTGYDWGEAAKQCYLNRILFEQISPRVTANYKVCERKQGKSLLSLKR